MQAGINGLCFATTSQGKARAVILEHTYKSHPHTAPGAVCRDNVHDTSASLRVSFAHIDKTAPRAIVQRDAVRSLHSSLDSGPPFTLRRCHCQSGRGRLSSVAPPSPWPPALGSRRKWETRREDVKVIRHRLHRGPSLPWRGSWSDHGDEEEEKALGGASGEMQVWRRESGNALRVAREAAATMRSSDAHSDDKGGSGVGGGGRGGREAPLSFLTCACTLSIAILEFARRTREESHDRRRGMPEQ